MLKKLYVDNYKCLVNFELELSELTLLLGRNGSGKTSVFDAVFALRRLLGDGAKLTAPDVFPTRTLTRWQDRNIQTFEIQAQLEDDVFRYRLEIGHERATNKARMELERLTMNEKPLFECKQGEVQLYDYRHEKGPKYSVDWSESALARRVTRRDSDPIPRFLNYISKVMVCGIYPPGFQAESKSEDVLLKRDASNFVSWFRHISQEHQDKVPAFIGAIKEVVEGLSGHLLPKAGEGVRALKVEFAGEKSEYPVYFDEISDGQRALFALYGLLYLSKGQGYTLFLDEPDNYVALPEIQPWLLDLMDACGESFPQAVIISHHPELIDYFAGNNSLVLEREKSGATTVGKLEDWKLEGGLKLSELIARGWEK